LAQRDHNDFAGQLMPSFSSKQVVLTDNTIRPEALARLQAHAEVRILDAYASEATMIQACRDADAILVRLGMVTASVIEAASRLRIVACHGSGSDSVDIPAATRHGIVVTNAGPANASAVAEYTFALLLALLRKVTAADASMRAGEWSRQPLIGAPLEGRTLGIVGCGAIGTRVARIAQGFGMTVLASEPARAGGDRPAVPTLPLPLLLARSDILSLHLRLTPGNAGIISSASIALMKPGAVLVNTARGELVDETALIAALTSGKLAGAALDTFAMEPLSPTSALRRMPNVVLSPHVAGQTSDALLQVGQTAVQAILDEFSGKQPAFVINPEVYVSRGKTGVRLSQ
jgi:D-3-phosphoglycerate dehydrogenase / 2-oxoglutarate reductase